MANAQGLSLSQAVPCLLLLQRLGWQGRFCPPRALLRRNLCPLHCTHSPDASINEALNTKYDHAYFGLGLLLALRSLCGARGTRLGPAPLTSSPLSHLPDTELALRPVSLEPLIL